MKNNTDPRRNNPHIHWIKIITDIKKRRWRRDEGRIHTFSRAAKPRLSVEEIDYKFNFGTPNLDQRKENNNFKTFKANFLLRELNFSLISFLFSLFFKLSFPLSIFLSPRYPKSASTNLFVRLFIGQNSDFKVPIWTKFKKTWGKFKTWTPKLLKNVQLGSHQWRIWPHPDFSVPKQCSFLQ